MGEGEGRVRRRVRKGVEGGGGGGGWVVRVGGVGVCDITGVCSVSVLRVSVWCECV